MRVGGGRDPTTTVETSPEPSLPPNRISFCTNRFAEGSSSPSEAPTPGRACTVPTPAPPSPMDSASLAPPFAWARFSFCSPPLTGPTLFKVGVLRAPRPEPRAAAEGLCREEDSRGPHKPVMGRGMPGRGEDAQKPSGVQTGPGEVTLSIPPDAPTLPSGPPPPQGPHSLGSPAFPTAPGSRASGLGWGWSRWSRDCALPPRRAAPRAHATACTSHPRAEATAPRAGPAPARRPRPTTGPAPAADPAPLQAPPLRPRPRGALPAGRRVRPCSAERGGMRTAGAARANKCSLLSRILLLFLGSLDFLSQLALLC